MSRVGEKSRLFHRTKHGRIYHGDALDVLEHKLDPGSVNLIMTSPPFGLVRKKGYGNGKRDHGNIDATEYIEWFRPFATAFKRVLRDDGSLVIDIGGSWVQGQPTRSLYHFKLLIMLVEEFGFHLAQEFYWWNPSKLPTPAEWVTVRRVRVKDAINCVWWLSPTPWPRADNRRVLQPYSPSMEGLLKNGYKARKRPSGHDISEKFTNNNGAAIPPNLIALPNTESNSYYMRYCREQNIEPHPARYPIKLPEMFIRMTTDPGDLVVDPFAGSCVTGEASELLERKWVCTDLVEDYLKGARARFHRGYLDAAREERNGTLLTEGEIPRDKTPDPDEGYYRIARPGLLWNGPVQLPLPLGTGERRPTANGAKSSEAADPEGWRARASAGSSPG